MENTVIRTVQMTGMHIIIAGYQVVRRWKAICTIPAGYRAVRRQIATRTIPIPAEYQAAHRRIATRMIPIPAEYRAVRRLEITAMEKIMKAVEAAKVAGGIISLVMEAVIIES